MKPKPSARSKVLVYTDYWDQEYKHAFYPGRLHTAHGDYDLSAEEAIRELCIRVDAKDGDGVRITVERVGRRPFGSRKVRFVGAGRYKRAKR